MYQFDEKEVLQAILIADNNVKDLRPFSDEYSTALLPLVNVPLLDYALEALNNAGIEQVFIYASLHLQTVREHIKRGIDSGSSWSIKMKVCVIGGESSRCFGDAMRDLDAKAIIRSNFIVLGADTVTNADLRAIFEQHKKTLKYDKGAAATVVFKEAASCLRTGNEVLIAMDAQNKRLHYHQRQKLHTKETSFDIPLEIFMLNSQIKLLHNLLDPQIAIGSPAMLSLFSDNFDFETYDDFVRGVLINEELLNSRIYVSMLPEKQYARKVNNWLTYQIVSQDVINRWAFPLVPDMGLHYLSQPYTFLRNNIYKNPAANVTKAVLRENVVVQKGSSVAAGSILNSSVIGSNCKVGAKCRLWHAYLMDNVTVQDGCELDFCVIGANTVIGMNCVLSEGTVVGANCIIPANSKLFKAFVKSKPNKEQEEVIAQISEKAFIIKDELLEKADSDDDDLLPLVNSTAKMTKLPMCMEESDSNSLTSDEEQSEDETPILDDTNIFLSEVMDSLTRGFQEKTNPDFLILEINSSRYAYNMSLQEVNFNVVKAIFSLDPLKQPANDNILAAVNNVLKQLGAIVANYIKNDDAMLDCLRALEDIYDENKFVREKISQILHYLYDKDFVSEEAILDWYDQININKKSALKQSLHRFIEWLNQSSDEDEDDTSE